LGGSEGTFSFAIDYMGTEYQSFVFAGDGTFDYDENYNGPTVGLDPSDNTYYILENGELGSQVYINFLHASLMSAIEGATLKDFIEKEHYFDLTAYGKADYTAQMNEYYQQSIEGKSEEDELYGFLPASKDLVEIITTMLVTRSSSTYNDDDGAWMMLSCYYEYYNATNRYIAAHFN
jgi:hypothetical protein